MRSSVIASVALLLAASAVTAQPMIFVHEVAESNGSLGGTPFGDPTPVPIRITAIFDIAQLQSGGSLLWALNEQAWISIDGVGPYFLIEQTATFLDTSTHRVGISQYEQFDLYWGPADAAFDGWDLKSSLGPIVGGAELRPWESSVLTSGGDLILEERETTGSFTAKEAIRYVHHGAEGSGTLGGVPFGDPTPVPYTFTSVSALADIESIPFPLTLTVDDAYSEIEIEGIDPVSIFAQTRHYFIPPTGPVGLALSPESWELFIGPDDPALLCFDLARSVGPVSGPGELTEWSVQPIATDGGVLYFDDRMTTATFTAIGQTIFADGFESGLETCWSSASPP